MKIPKRFKLFGQTITVEFVDRDAEVNGLSEYRRNKILLMRQVGDSKRTREQIEHTFCHELMHWLLYHAGEDQFDPPLHRREYLVDRLAGLLHQALTSEEA